MTTQNVVWMRSQHGGLNINLLNCELAMASRLGFVVALQAVAGCFTIRHSA
jgi:hypothetical protein